MSHHQNASRNQESAGENRCNNDENPKDHWGEKIMNSSLDASVKITSINLQIWDTYIEKFPTNTAAMRMQTINVLYCQWNVILHIGEISWGKLRKELWSISMNPWNSVAILNGVSSISSWISMLTVTKILARDSPQKLVRFKKQPKRCNWIDEAP